MNLGVMPEALSMEPSETRIPMKIHAAPLGDLAQDQRINADQDV
jgi:hypothetical protein